jgi:alkylation response protein AidB-like acyl-CoA dehydrogenase
MIDFSFSEEQTLLRDAVAKRMGALATPEYVRRLDREQAYPYDLYEAWAELGLFRMPFDEGVGGLGGSVIDMAIIAEELARQSFDFFTAYGATVFCALNVARHGSEAQRAAYLPRVFDGSLRMAVAMSEPEAGSDAGAMRTSARRDGDDWLISGQKLWCTGGGARGTLLNVYARTDRDAHYRKGITLFLVPNDAPGIELRKLDMLGRRAVGTYEIFFDDVRVPASGVVGEPNRGWSYLLSGLQLERVASSAGYCGAMQSVVEMAVAYAQERKQFGRAIGTFQAIAHLLADMQTEADAARLLMLRAAWKLARGEDALREVSMSKLFGSETYARLANQGMQVLGAYGYNMEFDMQRHFRDARSTTIGAGTSQMQRNIIAGTLGLKVE